VSGKALLPCTRLIWNLDLAAIVLVICSRTTVKVLSEITVKFIPFLNYKERNFSYHQTQPLSGFLVELMKTSIRWNGTEAI
jgi:hypothetical protein